MNDRDYCRHDHVYAMGICKKCIDEIKIIKISLWGALTKNDEVYTTFNNEEEAKAHKKNYSYITRIVKLTGSYEIEVPEKVISITEEKLRSAMLEGSILAKFKGGYQDTHTVKLLFGDQND